MITELALSTFKQSLQNSSSALAKDFIIKSYESQSLSQLRSNCKYTYNQITVKWAYYTISDTKNYFLPVFDAYFLLFFPFLAVMLLLVELSLT